VLSYEALVDGFTADDLLRRLLARVARPEVPLHDHPNRVDHDATSDLHR
jgi:hypothetical protein